MRFPSKQAVLRVVVNAAVDPRKPQAIVWGRKPREILPSLMARKEPI